MIKYVLCAFAFVGFMGISGNVYADPGGSTGSDNGKTCTQNSDCQCNYCNSSKKCSGRC